MKTLVSLFLLSIVLTVSGCSAWKKIPAAPEYTHEAPIPLKVGVILLQEDTRTGLEAIKSLKEMQLFDSLIYPYEGAPVDVVMQLIIAGGREGFGEVTETHDIREGFGEVTTTHNVRASIKKSSDVIGRYSLQATSTIESGMGYELNPGLFGAGTTLQGKRIAFEIAKNIRADRSNLLSKYSKSQEGKPFATVLAYKKGEYQNAATIIFFKEDTAIEPKKEEASNGLIFYASDTSGTGSMEAEDIVSCIENGIKRNNPDQSFISFSKFAQAMFPDNLETHVPKVLESFSTLLADVTGERFYKDALSWGIRYLIFVGGASETVGHGGLLTPASSDFRLGVWGVMYWDNKTQIAASVLDLHQKETAADNIENTSEDSSWLAMAWWLPIGFPSSTESDSCEDVGNHISKILLDRSKQ